VSERSRALLKQYAIEARGGGVTPPTIEQLRTMILEDSPDGYDVFYATMRARLPPAHVSMWIERLYEAKQLGLWFGNEAFRGATKTTAITETFTAYQMALHPERSNFFLQADDIKAAMHARNVADMVAKNPMWRALFTDVVPDEERGWGSTGYWIKRASTGDEWSRIRHKDPSLIGSGYAANIVSLHPIGVVNVDDINNDKNTESEAMSDEANRILTDSLYPMMEDVAWHIFSQTPWTKRDALAKAKSTGLYDWARTPVMRVVPEGTKGAELVRVEIGGEIIYVAWGIPTWPEKFGPQRIARCYKASGQKGFARMYLLDLTQAEGLNLREEWLHSYPLDRVSQDWPVYMGIDYASTSEVGKNEDRDYFALAVVRAIPGLAVVMDGIRERLPRGDAEKKVRAIASMYPTLNAIGVEMEGKGEQFYEQLASTGNLKLLPMRTLGRSKPFRFEEVMAKHFEFSRVWVSDRATPFLRAFRDEWTNWDAKQKHQHDDTLDAVYYALASAGVFMRSAEEPEEIAYSTRRKKALSPWAIMGRGHV